MTKRDLLQDIVNMTEIMLDHAKTGDWNSVISMEANRQKKMDKYFAMPLSSEDADWISASILSIVDFDKDIMELGSSDLNKLGSTLSQVQRGKKAQFAYQKLA